MTLLVHPPLLNPLALNRGQSLSILWHEQRFNNLRFILLVPLNERLIVPQFSWWKFFCRLFSFTSSAIAYTYRYFNFKNNIDEMAQQFAQKIHDIFLNSPDINHQLNDMIVKLAEIADKIEKISSDSQFNSLGMDNEAIRFDLLFALIDQEKNCLEFGETNAFALMREALLSSPTKDSADFEKAIGLLDVLITLKTGELPAQPETPAPQSAEEPLSEQPLLESPPQPQTPAAQFARQVKASGCPHVAEFLSTLTAAAAGIESATFDQATGKFTITFDQAYTIYLSIIASGLKGNYEKPDADCNKLGLKKTLQGTIKKVGDKEIMTFSDGTAYIPTRFKNFSISGISYRTEGEQTVAELQLPIVGAQKIPVKNFEGIMNASYMYPSNVSFNANNLLPHYSLAVKS